MSKKADNYVTRQTAQRVITVVRSDLGKRLQQARNRGDKSVELSIDDIETIDHALVVARGALVGA